MEFLLSRATMVALLYFSAGLIQSFCYMNGRLPEERRSPIYPKEPGKVSFFNLSWMFQLICAVVMSLSYGLVYVGAALAIYFLVLPFVFQIPMARMLGFKSLQEYVKTVDGVN